ncbi:MAG: HupE/UreJ family protein [Gallionella sp.]|nr:HupE/UreJ family protein [Gallionella sp.]
MKNTLHTRFIFLLLLLVPGWTFAHTGIGAASGWTDGLLHPFLGLDHLFAMIAVGLWARQLGGRARWLAPTTFVCVMAAGGWLGMAAVPLPFVEGGILASLLVLGVLIAAAIRLPIFASMALVGFFALFHGYAHGAEMPRTISGLSYAFGFMLSAAALHLAGIIIANSFDRAGLPHWLRLAGASIAAFGGAFLWVG